VLKSIFVCKDDANIIRFQTKHQLSMTLYNVHEDQCLLKRRLNEIQQV